MAIYYYTIGGKLVLIDGKAIWKDIPSYLNMVISGGFNHSVLLNSIDGFSPGFTTTNQVWCWGVNNYGQLGDNSTTNKCTPVSILGTKKTFCTIASGRDYILGIDNNSQVWCWGSNSNGQLGDNTTVSKCTPVSILGAKKTFCNITAGYWHGIGIDNNLQVWGWGYNLFGQLGDNTIVSRLTPVSILGAKKTFCAIDGTYGNTIGIEKNGQVWGWGRNSNGQLGDNTTVSKLTPVSILGSKKTFCKIITGRFYTIGLDYNGQAWGWGYNTQGQIGDNTVTQRLTPVSILGTKKTFCEITAMFNSTIGIDKNGQVWCWGLNNYGQLGDNSTTNKCTPVSILGTKKTFCKISTGAYHTIGVDKYGKVWGWGYNTFGQLGDNSASNKVTPMSILGTKKTFCQIIIGNHTIGIDRNGQIWCWGYNLYGQLGDNSSINKYTPVSILGSKKTFCEITIPKINNYSIGLDKNGQVWGWGYNTQGQLGDNTTTSKCTPVSILGTKKTFCKIAAGYQHTIGIDYNGQVWCWGQNTQGQLGDNSITNKCTPVSILGSKKTFCSISGGMYHTIGLDKNGQIWGWGYNRYGQLGDNSITSQRTPVSILGVKKTFCAIGSAVVYHTIGLDKNGQIWCWGYNVYGQLGDNSITSQRTPVSILGTKKTFCSISGGMYHTIGLDKNGQVWCWGYNGYGQLGDNLSANKYTPVSILGTKKTFCAIGSGNYNSIGIDKYGQVWGWGQNNYGQLATDYYNSTTPLRVCNF